MSSFEETTSPVAEFITRPDGARIAYHVTPGKSPGVVFLTGFKSDMTGGKAVALERFCRARGQAFVRFDYFGHGDSSGEFEAGTIGRWADDAVFVLDKLTTGPQVLVGSSMGGWIMLLAALARKPRVAGLVGIAAAPDFTEDLISSRLTEAQKADLARRGYCEVENCYDDQEPYRIEKRLLDEGRDHLLLRGDIAIDVPVRLIQGMQDEDVPWRTALTLCDRLATDDVEVHFTKPGTHRLSEEPDLERLRRTVGGLLDRLEAQGVA